MQLFSGQYHIKTGACSNEQPEPWRFKDFFLCYLFTPLGLFLTSTSSSWKDIYIIFPLGPAEEK